MQNKEQGRLCGGRAVFLSLLTLVWWLLSQWGNEYCSVRLERVGLVSMKDAEWVVMAGHKGKGVCGGSMWVGAPGRAAGALADLSRPFMICAPLHPGFTFPPGPQLHVALGKWLPALGLCSLSVKQK